MVNKVTKETLKSLIEGVLSEKVMPSIKLADLEDKIYSSSKPEFTSKEKDIKDLAGLEDDPKSIEQSDVTAAFADKANNKDEIDASKWLAGNIQRSKPESGKMINFVANAAADATKFEAGDVKTIDPEKIRSIAFKSMQTVSADPSNPTDMGQFPEGIATAINVAMSGKNSFKERMDHLAEITKEAVSDLSNSNKSQQPKDITDYISKMLILDYVSTLVREVDSGSAAYFFEAFLAMLVGGRVVGKEITPSGKMGGADFRASDGSAGSSKYYSQLSSAIAQSSKGFVLGEPVFYVVCIKDKKDKSSIVHQLNLYTLFVNKIAEDVNGSDYFAFKYSNGEIEIKEVKTGQKVSIGANLAKKGDPLLIELATVKDNKDIRSQISAVTKKRTDNLAMAIKKMETISKNLYTADQKSQAYGATGEISKADEALDSIKQSEQAIREISVIISPGSTLTKESKKITQDYLKTIIEESFKKNK